MFPGIIIATRRRALPRLHPGLNKANRAYKADILEAIESLFPRKTLLLHIASISPSINDIFNSPVLAVKLSERKDLLHLTVWDVDCWPSTPLKDSSHGRSGRLKSQSQRVS
jgi:hypothetical protein